MSQCIKCGASVKRQDHYCAKCGEPLQQIAIKEPKEKTTDVVIAVILLFFLCLTGLWIMVQDKWEADRTSKLSINQIQSVDNNGAVIELTQKLESLKTKEFYSDPILKNLGLTKVEITSIYGTPEISEHWGPGGEMYSYIDKGISFVFAGEETEIVNNILLSSKSEEILLDVRVGMTFKEIEAILGKPEWAGLFEEGSDYGDYGMIYHLGDQRDMESEIMVQFFAQSNDGSTHIALIMWKAYWW